MPAVKRLKPLASTALLNKTYFNAQHPASFGGIDKLSKATHVSPVETEKWLKEQWAYSLHKPTRQKFPRRKYVSRGLNEQWQADLVEMQHYSVENQGYRYILCVIDIFSRYAYARPLMTKSGPDVAKALSEILDKDKPKFLQTDQGLEFYNQHVKALLEKHDITLFSVYSDKKAAIVERFQRTLQERMYRAFTYQGNHKWVTLLPQLITSYNNTVHRSIKTTPAKVNKKNETDVWLVQYDELQTNAKPKFKVGDRVRIPKQRTIFTKGYIEKWTDEVFIVHEVNTKYKPALYTLKDDDGKNEIIQGSFYEQELQLAMGDEYRIDRVMRTRMKGKKKQALVKWKGYTNPTWIDRNQLHAI
jgi:transposase InsO family protein